VKFKAVNGEKLVKKKLLLQKKIQKECKLKLIQVRTLINQEKLLLQI